MKLIVGNDSQGAVVVDLVGPGVEHRVTLTVADAETLADEVFAAALIAHDALRHEGEEDRAVDAERDRRLMQGARRPVSSSTP
jgi:hypothetical protein